MSNEIELSFLVPSEKMDKANYDSNDNQIVDVAASIDGITGAANSTFYGKNESGVVGFHTVASGGANAINDLTDVNTTGLASNDVLQWDGSSFVPKSFAEIAASDIDVSGASNGQALIFNSGTGVFEPANISAGGASQLTELSDVTLSSPSSGQVLSYNGSAWVNKAPSTPNLALNDLTDVTGGGTSGQVLTYNGSTYALADVPTGVSEIRDLSDVAYLTASNGDLLGFNGTIWTNVSYDLSKLDSITVAGATDGQALIFNSGSGDFEPTTIPTGGASTLGELSDVNATATSGQVLTFNGTSFEFQTPTGGGSAGQLSDLSDVDTTGVSDGQVLAYNGATSQFEPTTPSGGGSVTGASVERIRMNFTGTDVAAGTVGTDECFSDNTPGVTGILKNNDSVSNIICTFNFTGYNNPPANIMLYGYDVRNQRYSIRTIGLQTQHVAFSTSGDESNPNTFGSFSSLEMLLTTSLFGAAKKAALPAIGAHGYVVFTMQG